MNLETPPLLGATLAKLRERIHEMMAGNVPEEAVKAALINPLLSALGWDVEDFREVRMEYRRTPKDNPVDYALFLRGTPCLFLEAKAPDITLDDYKWITKTVAYANAAGVEWCVLTNGDEYHLYNAFAKAHVEKKLFRKVRISDPDQDRYVLATLGLLSKDQIGRLIEVWKLYLIDCQVEAALNDLFRIKDAKLLSLLKKRTTGLRPADIRSSLKRATITVEFPLPPTAVPKKTTRQRSQRRYAVIHLIDASIIKTPFELTGSFKGKNFSATIGDNGTVTFQKKTFNSLSAAASAAMATVAGGKPAVDGWLFWKTKEGQAVGTLRPESKAKAAAKTDVKSGNAA